MSTFAVKFLGCKVSQADAMSARAALLEAGHVEVPEAEAELHVVNTCCITSEAESKSRQSVRRSLRTAGEVYVGGCAVNLNARQFSEIGAEVRPFVGTAEEVASDIVAARGLGGCADIESDVLVRVHEPSTRALEPSTRTLEPSTRTLEPSTRTRGFVKIQDGCDCHCAYCIIPTVRGPARSRPAGAVLREAQHRARRGQPEIVLTGISVGDYRDPDRGFELGQLMMAVAQVDGVERVRLSSVEVIHVKDSLLEALATEPKVCPHLHIPMQSGDDGVLRAMGRHYTAQEYLNQVIALRSALHDVNITTDVIVGFPSEDEQAFDRTLGLLDQAGITRAHVFPYSPRPGTVAQALGDCVAPAEKKHRSQAVRGRCELRARQHRTRKLGCRESVLVDKVAETQCSGYTADYTRCYLPPGAGERGRLVTVIAEELHADGLRCRPA